MIKCVLTRLNLFRRNEDGVTAIEYGVIMALLSSVLLVALPSVTSSISNPLGSLTDAINNGGGASSGDDSEGEDESDDDGESDDSDSDDGDSDHGESDDDSESDDGESEDS